MPNAAASRHDRKNHVPGVDCCKLLHLRLDTTPERPIPFPQDALRKA